MTHGAEVFSVGFDELVEGVSFESRGRTITEADVMLFAATSGDYHPQHVDAEWASRSRFGKRIAHGALLVAYATGLVPVDPERVVALRRLSDVTFKAPAYLGDTVRVRGRISRLRQLDDHYGLVTSTWKVIDQDDRTLAVMKVEVIWRRSTSGRAVESDAEAPSARPLDAPDPDVPICL
jgi:3-hydroxybutyryl-CoA dehydratase